MKTINIMLMFLVGCCLTQAFASDRWMPKGWRIVGNNPDVFSVASDTSNLNRQHVKTIRFESAAAKRHDYAAIIQTVKANKYKGSRVQLTAYIKSENVENNAGFWLRAYNGEELLVLNNMGNQTIYGTTVWKPYNLAIDVPNNSGTIVFGAYLTGKGKVWLAKVDFKTIPKTAPLKNITEGSNLKSYGTKLREKCGALLEKLTSRKSTKPAPQLDINEQPVNLGLE